MITVWLFFKLIQVELKKSTVPENFDSGAVENQLDQTPEAQVDASGLEWPDSRV